MVLKLLSIIWLIHSTLSNPQFGFDFRGSDIGRHVTSRARERIVDVKEHVNDLRGHIIDARSHIAGADGRQRFTNTIGDVTGRIGDLLANRVHNAVSSPNDYGGLLPSAAYDPISSLNGYGGLKPSGTNSGRLPSQVHEHVNHVRGIIENFLQFKSTFKKTYFSEAEENFRNHIFNANLQFIKNHNELFKFGKQTFSVAINFFGDWSHSEYLDILGVDLSQVPNNYIGHTTGINKRRARSSDCPEHMDWRQGGAVTPVKNQLKCASCWAFAAAGALESHFFLKNGILNSFSEQQFVDCSIEEGKGCRKGLMNTVFEYSQRNGIVTEDKYPYRGVETGNGNSCNYFDSSMRITRFENIPRGSEEDLKEAVCRHGPVSVAIDASSELFMHYQNGIYRSFDCNPSNTTHGVLVVGYGYDEYTDEPYWLIKNSYSSSWGEDGYVRIPRNFNNHCGVASLASYPVV